VLPCPSASSTSTTTPTPSTSPIESSPAAGWREIGSHDAEDGDELVVSLIEALAEATALDVDDLSPLYEVVDPEALEAFLARSPDARATFVYLDREVAIDGAGTFAVRPLTE